MHRAAYIYLIFATLFWGGNAVAGKLAVGHISPMLITAGRWGVTALVLGALGWRQVRADWPAIRAHWRLLVLLGVLGFTLFNVALYGGLLFTTAVNVSIEQAGVPMFVFLTSFIVFRTHVSAAQLVGFLLSLLGIAVVASHGQPSRLLELDLNLGDLMMVGGALVYGVYTALLRLKPQIHWISLMAALSVPAAIASLPFVALESGLGALILPDARGWVLMAYIVVFPSLLAQVFYIRGVEMIGANRAGLFVNLVPIFGTLVSILLLGEAFFAYHAVALALVFGGIAIAEASGRHMAAAGADGH
ncbi:MAG: DMT family transporter [Rhizobiaceae bacterium]|nr:DMT family transporter [Rhizobiaceae bacterium]